MLTSSGTKSAIGAALGRARHIAATFAIALGVGIAGLTPGSAATASTDKGASATTAHRLPGPPGFGAQSAPARRIKAKAAPRRRIKAKAASTPQISYRLVSRHDGRCLDNNIAWGGPYDGTRVQVWDCNGWDNQRWYYNTENKTIRSAHDGRCLDADTSTSTRNGTKVQVWGCWGGNNQRWFVYDDGTIRSAHDGRCLDLNVAYPTRNGTKVQLWDCNGWNNQAWTWRTLP